MTIIQTVLLFIAALLAVGTLTPIMRSVAIKINFFDRPNAAHKSQVEPTPYLGGVAIILGTLVVTYSALLTQSNLDNKVWIANSVFGPALILGVVGLIDDYISLDPLPRFIAQSTAGIFTGVLIVTTNTVGNPTGKELLDVLITIVWFIGISNAINFFDNVDGGTSGSVAVISFGLFLITQSNGQFLIAATAITIFGAMCGFLVWNKNPAKIYMGDAGSLFLGIVLATLTVRLNPDSENSTVSFAIPLLLLAVPILDTSVALISRIRRKRSIFMGGKDHLSHRLLRKGFSKQQVAFLLWLMTGCFVSISIALAVYDFNTAFPVFLAALFWLALLIVFLRTADE